jgi:hypothetical protein
MSRGGHWADGRTGGGEGECLHLVDGGGWVGGSWLVYSPNYMGITWGEPGPIFSGFNAASYVFNFFSED